MRKQLTENSARPRVEIRGRKANELRELEPHFWRILEASYSKTERGHTAVHKARYRWLLKSNPHSMVYFASVNGEPVALGLVLQKKERWYGFAADNTQLKKISGKQAVKVLGEAMDGIAEKISHSHPTAWGTVNAQDNSRRRFFERHGWKAVATRQEVLAQFRRMGERYDARQFHIQIIEGKKPFAQFTRATSVNGPKYAQVLFVRQPDKK